MEERQLGGTDGAYKDIMRGIAKVLMEAADSEDELHTLREMLSVQKQNNQVKQKGIQPQMPF